MMLQVHLQVRCTATNEGRMDADEVVMLFHVPGDDVASRVGNAHPLPRRTLVGFERVAVAAGQVGRKRDGGMGGCRSEQEGRVVDDLRRLC